MMLSGIRSVESLDPFSGRDYRGDVSIRLEIPKVEWRERPAFLRGILDHYIKELDQFDLTDHAGGGQYQTANMIVINGALITQGEWNELNVMLVYTVAADFNDQRAEVFLQLFFIE
jgi:hypothetical protein